MDELDKLDHDVFYGITQMCNKCRKRNDNCTNRECREELRRMLRNEKRKENEQLDLGI